MVLVYYTSPMARTYHQRKRGRVAAGPALKKSVTPAASKKQGGRKKKESTRTRVLRWAGLSSICCVVAVLAFAAGGYLGLVKGVENLKEASGPSHPTYIYSAPVGETSGSTRAIGTIFGGENRREADLEKMPTSLLDALVAKEDERFREHGGVDLWGIIRALWTDIRVGEPVEGASTITQQYVKNAYLSGQPTLGRKLKEAAIAVEIERKYEKDEILGMYLNTVYFGNSAYGVEAAAETYFNKSAEDLTVGESAALIGLLWAPSTLGTDREEATTQRNFVLYKMRDAGYITRQDHMEALDEALPEPWPKAPMVETGLTGPSLTKNFAEFVRDELVTMYGANTVLAGGLSVYTTLDLKAQVEAHESLYKSGGYLSNPEDPEAALVSIEPDTGRIKAMVGNRDESNFNLVTQARRQPGSSFKPFALIAALEQGIDPSTQFVSESKQYTIKDENDRPEQWQVDNYEEENHGPISLEKALWVSDNSVFTDLVTNANGRGLENGPETVADVANRLGVSAHLDPHPSIVLGSQEVSPLDMATAYATIANEGKRVTPKVIDKVVQDEGQEEEKVLYTAPQEEGEQVIDPEVAHKITEIMIGNITQGIAAKASLDDRPAAGKTGTTENFFDAWFVGFTPQLVTGVWMGYEEGGKTLDGLLNIGSRQQRGPLAPPIVIWQNYMQKVLQDESVKEFEGVNVAQNLVPASTTDTAGIPGATAPPAGAGPVGGEIPPGSATPDLFPNNPSPDSSPNQFGVPVAAYFGN